MSILVVFQTRTQKGACEASDFKGISSYNHLKLIFFNELENFMCE